MAAQIAKETEWRQSGGGHKCRDRGDSCGGGRSRFGGRVVADKIAEIPGILIRRLVKVGSH